MNAARKLLSPRSAGLWLTAFALLAGRAGLAGRPAGGAEAIEFPAFDAPRSVEGELVGADFVHRSGEIRKAGGELIPFTLLPCGSVTYLGTESDLRDVPLGARMEFLLLPDEDGRPRRLVATKHDGAFDAQQRSRFVAFTQARGLAGRVESTAGKTLTVTFFSGTPELFAATWNEAFAPGSDVSVAAANDELRTWNAATTAEKAKITHWNPVPIAGHGSSGWQATIQTNQMQEGFRRGRVVRVFGAGWKPRNQLFQECLVNYGYSHNPAPDFRENMAKHYPEQFPYRTDFGNRRLPWYSLREGVPPPSFSAHLMIGELTRVDATTRSGEFKTELTGEPVSFSLYPTGPKPPIRYRSSSFEGVNAKLGDLPIGQRFRFQMFLGSDGKFSQCMAISDDYSHAALNSLTWQIRGVDLARQRIEVAWQRLPVKNYNGDMETPPPYGHSLLRVDAETRVWNEATAVTLGDLKIGDNLRINFTSEQPEKPSRCAEIWIVDVENLRKRR